MKNRLPLLLALIATITCVSWTLARTKRKPPKLQVKGTILQQSDYCGGAANVKLYIKKSGTNTNKPAIDSIVSDKDGKFTVWLTPGVYCFVEKWKTEKYTLPANNSYVTYDSACYRQRYDQCDFVLEVKKDMNEPQIVLRRHCAWTTPCQSYNGPLPPSAPPSNRGGYQPGHQE
jgi:hypothetical protein